MPRTLLVILFILPLLSVDLWATPKIEPEIAVKIASSLSEVEIRGTDLSRKFLINNNLKIYQGAQIVRFNCRNFSSKLQSKEKAIPVAELESKTGLISWNGRHYRGKLLVYTTPGKSSCDLVNKFPMEFYISSLLTKEMNSSWPMEALKAQAVAARTYAYYRIQTAPEGSYYHLENSEYDQVNGAFFDETIRTFKAAKETKGEILLTLRGVLTPAFFHSKCGARTFLPQEVWGGEVAGYQTVPCIYGKNLGPKPWTHEMTGQEMYEILPRLLSNSGQAETHKQAAQLIKVLSKGEKIIIPPDSMTKSVLRFYVGKEMVLLEKNLWRRFLGRKKFPSNSFALQEMKGRFVFRGEGNGHGVGLCQYGALHMSRLGHSYNKILSYYYPGHKLMTIY